MGSLYRRGTTWWVKYYRDGQAIRESTGTRKRHEAQRFLDLHAGAVAKGAPIPVRLDRIPYEELATDLRAHYETTGKRRLAEVEDRLVHLDRFFTGQRVAMITPGRVTEYVQQRQRDRIVHRGRCRDGHLVETVMDRAPSNRTINIELALLKRLLRLGAENGKVDRVPPIRLLKEAPARAGFFEPAQYAAVCRSLPPDLQVAVAIAHTYGWRIRSEVLALQRKHVDLHAGVVRLEGGMTKNGEPRAIALTPELARALGEQLARVDAVQRRVAQIIPWVFPHLDGMHRGTPRRGFTKAWRTACRRVGVPGRLLHDFRRTAVRNLERAGVARSVAMKITGHKTESVYRRYAIVNEADLREAMEKVATVSGTIPGTIGHTSLETRRVSVQNNSREALAQPGRAPAF